MSGRRDENRVTGTHKVLADAYAFDGRLAWCQFVERSSLWMTDAIYEPVPRDLGVLRDELLRRGHDPCPVRIEEGSEGFGRGPVELLGGRAQR